MTPQVDVKKMADAFYKKAADPDPKYKTYHEVFDQVSREHPDGLPDEKLWEMYLRPKSTDWWNALKSGTHSGIASLSDWAASASRLAEWAPPALPATLAQKALGALGVTSANDEGIRQLQGIAEHEKKAAAALPKPTGVVARTVAAVPQVAAEVLPYLLPGPKGLSGAKGLLAGAGKMGLVEGIRGGEQGAEEALKQGMQGALMGGALFPAAHYVLGPTTSRALAPVATAAPRTAATAGRFLNVGLPMAGIGLGGALMQPNAGDRREALEDVIPSSLAMGALGAAGGAFPKRKAAKAGATTPPTTPPPGAPAATGQPAAQPAAAATPAAAPAAAPANPRANIIERLRAENASQPDPKKRTITAARLMAFTRGDRRAAGKLLDQLVNEDQIVDTWGNMLSAPGQPAPQATPAPQTTAAPQPAAPVPATSQPPATGQRRSRKKTAVAAPAPQPAGEPPLRQQPTQQGSAPISAFDAWRDQYFQRGANGWQDASGNSYTGERLWQMFWEVGGNAPVSASGQPIAPQTPAASTPQPAAAPPAQPAPAAAPQPQAWTAETLAAELKAKGIRYKKQTIADYKVTPDMAMQALKMAWQKPAVAAPPAQPAAAPAQPAAAPQAQAPQASAPATAPVSATPPMETAADIKVGDWVRIPLKGGRWSEPKPVHEAQNGPGMYVTIRGKAAWIPSGAVKVDPPANARNPEAPIPAAESQPAPIPVPQPAAQPAGTVPDTTTPPAFAAGDIISWTGKNGKTYSRTVRVGEDGSLGILRYSKHAPIPPNAVKTGVEAPKQKKGKGLAKEMAEKGRGTLVPKPDAVTPPQQAGAPHIAVGDPVQWTSQGVDQFPTPRKVTQTMQGPDGKWWAFVEGSNTGILMEELAKTAPPVDEAPLPNKSKRAPRRRGSKQRPAETAPAAEPQPSATAAAEPALRPEVPTAPVVDQVAADKRAADEFFAGLGGEEGTQYFDWKMPGSPGGRPAPAQVLRGLFAYGREIVRNTGESFAGWRDQMVNKFGGGAERYLMPIWNQVRFSTPPPPTGSGRPGADSLPPGAQASSEGTDLPPSPPRPAWTWQKQPDGTMVPVLAEGEAPRWENLREPGMGKPPATPPAREAKPEIARFPPRQVEQAYGVKPASLGERKAPKVVRKGVGPAVTKAAPIPAAYIGPDTSSPPYEPRNAAETASRVAASQLADRNAAGPLTYGLPSPAMVEGAPTPPLPKPSKAELARLAKEQKKNQAAQRAAAKDAQKAALERQEQKRREEQAAFEREREIAEELQSDAQYFGEVARQQRRAEELAGIEQRPGPAPYRFSEAAEHRAAVAAGERRKQRGKRATRKPPETPFVPPSEALPGRRRPANEPTLRVGEATTEFGQKLAAVVNAGQPGESAAPASVSTGPSTRQRPIKPFTRPGYTAAEMASRLEQAGFTQRDTSRNDPDSPNPRMRGPLRRLPSGQMADQIWVKPVDGGTIEVQLGLNEFQARKYYTKNRPPSAGADPDFSPAGAPKAGAASESEASLELGERRAAPRPERRAGYESAEPNTIGSADRQPRQMAEKESYEETGGYPEYLKEENSRNILPGGIESTMAEIAKVEGDLRRAESSLRIIDPEKTEMRAAAQAQVDALAQRRAALQANLRRMENFEEAGGAGPEKLVNYLNDVVEQERPIPGAHLSGSMRDGGVASASVAPTKEPPAAEVVGRYRSMPEVLETGETAALRAVDQMLRSSGELPGKPVIQNSQDIQRVLHYKYTPLDRRSILKADKNPDVANVKRLEDAGYVPAAYVEGRSRQRLMPDEPSGVRDNLTYEGTDIGPREHLQDALADLSAAREKAGKGTLGENLADAVMARRKREGVRPPTARPPAAPKQRLGQVPRDNVGFRVPGIGIYEPLPSKQVPGGMQYDPAGKLNTAKDKFILYRFTPESGKPPVLRVMDNVSAREKAAKAEAAATGKKKSVKPKPWERPWDHLRAQGEPLAPDTAAPPADDAMPFTRDIGAVDIPGNRKFEKRYVSENSWMIVPRAGGQTNVTVRGERGKYQIFLGGKKMLPGEGFEGTREVVEDEQGMQIFRGGRAALEAALNVAQGMVERQAAIDAGLEYESKRSGRPSKNPPPKVIIDYNAQTPERYSRTTEPPMEPPARDNGPIPEDYYEDIPIGEAPPEYLEPPVREPK